MPARPEFNMEEANRILSNYRGGRSNFPVAQCIVDGFVKDYKESHKGYKYSDRGISVDTSQEVTYHKGKTVEQEANGNERREETREAFLGRAVQTLPEVAERGTLAYGYRQYHSQLSPKIQAAEKGLKNLGIPVVVFEQIEGNKDGVTTIHRNDAMSIFCLRFVDLLIFRSNLFMERAIFPSAITIPLHQNRFPLPIGEVDRHRQSSKPLAPNINPITCPVEWASHINTFPTVWHRYPSEITCVLMAFCLHHNAGFRHGFDTVIVGKKQCFLSVFCPCFVARKSLFLYYF
jgi:hypothetical protein